MTRARSPLVKARRSARGVYFAIQTARYPAAAHTATTIKHQPSFKATSTSLADLADWIKFFGDLLMLISLIQ